jgi:hypothetical protein
MKQKIVFTNMEPEKVSDFYKPMPSSHFLPEWYKKTPSYLGGEREVFSSDPTNSTIKKCIPVFDVLTAGYIISTPFDIYVKKDEGGNLRYIDSYKSGIEQHSISQAPYHPAMNHQPFPKFINPWSIKTPTGYSSLIINPVHSENKIFKIFEGFVDTDTYTTPVNLPFTFIDLEFEGLIKAGTPIAQIIPVKRDEWINEVKVKDKDFSVKNIEVLLRSKLFDRYKNLFWNKKSYR